MSEAVIHGGREMWKDAASMQVSAGLRWATVGAALVGLGLTGYLAATAMARGAVAGCGGGSDCGRALNSAWAWWLGIPISGLAAVVYLGILVIAAQSMRSNSVRMQRRCWTTLAALGGMLVGAAVWCIYLLVFRLGVMCPYCTASHLVGLLTAGFVFIAAFTARGLGAADRPKLMAWREWTLAALVTAAGMAGLIGGQIWWPTATYALVETSALVDAGDRGSGDGHQHDHAEASLPPPRVTELVREVDGQRVIAPEFTNVVLNPREVPMSGSPDAPHLLVLVFDYTCEACVRTHRLLWFAQQRYGDQLGIVEVTCPANSKCNPTFKSSKSREGACEYAKLALALWRISPQVYEQFQSWIIGFTVAPPVDVGVKKAIDLAGREAVERALADPWVERQFQQNIEFSRPLMEYFHGTPVLVLGSKIMDGIPDDPEAFCDVLGKELQLTPVDAAQKGDTH